MRRFFSWHLDFLGFLLSLICALHCMLMPLVFAFGIIVGAQWLMDPIGERIFIGASIVIAGWSLWRSYIHSHQNIRPLLIVGLVFVGLLLAQILRIPYTHGLMAIGGGLIGYAHFYNWQLTHPAKETIIKKRFLINPGRVVVIILLLLYFLEYVMLLYMIQHHQVVKGCYKWFGGIKQKDKLSNTFLIGTISVDIVLRFGSIDEKLSWIIIIRFNGFANLESMY